MTKVFQADIVKRFLDEKAYKNFEQEYHENKRGGYARQATDKDLTILMEYRKGALMSELARKYKCSVSAINTSIRIAAVSKLK